MSAADITLIVATFISLLSAVLVPWWLRRRDRADRADRTDLVSWQGLNATLRQDVADLRSQRDRETTEWQRRMAELEQEHARQMAIARQRISQLEREVSELYRRLYGPTLRPEAGGANG